MPDPTISIYTRHNGRWRLVPEIVVREGEEWYRVRRGFTKFEGAWYNLFQEQLRIVVEENSVLQPELNPFTGLPESLGANSSLNIARKLGLVSGFQSTPLTEPINVEVIVIPGVQWVGPSHLTDANYFPYAIDTVLLHPDSFVDIEVNGYVAGRGGGGGTAEWQTGVGSADATKGMDGHSAIRAVCNVKIRGDGDISAGFAGAGGAHLRPVNANPGHVHGSGGGAGAPYGYHSFPSPLGETHQEPEIYGKWGSINQGGGPGRVGVNAFGDEGWPGGIGGSNNAAASPSSTEREGPGEDAPIFVEEGEGSIDVSEFNGNLFGDTGLN